MRYALNYELLATTIGGEDGQVPGEGSSPPQVLATMTASQAGAGSGAGQGDSGGGGVYRHRRQTAGGAARRNPYGCIGHTQYNATKAALYQRIAEIIVTNLGRLAQVHPG